MNLDNITPQGYILAMIIRDDGERILLGDGAYVFKDSQQHFQPNTFANDVVELQGTDGQLLAGQVRRTAIQTFAGYIGDASTSQQRVEQYRKQFLMFFRKKFHYTAVYIFHDGSAIQRKRGYIATAPAVPELYQKYPEWSVGLNFEDTNYYEYAEDDEGNEIYAHAVQIAISNAVSGGLIWDNNGATSDDLGYTGTPIDGNGKNFQLTNTSDKILKSAELLGDAEQTTYSGKNLLEITNTTESTSNGVKFTPNSDGSIKIKGTATNTAWFIMNSTLVLPAGTYTYSSHNSTLSAGTAVLYNDSFGYTGEKKTITLTGNSTGNWSIRVSSGAVMDTTVWPMIESGSNMTDFEPFVGSTPTSITASPNPDYPQAVNVVTGENVVKIEGKNLFKGGNADYTGAQAWNGYGNTAYTLTDGAYTMPDRFGAIAFEYDDLVVGQQYTISFDATASAQTDVRVGFNRYTNAPVVGDQYQFTATTQTQRISWTFTATEQNRIAFNSGIVAGTSVTFSNIQLELGSTATTYEPYQGQTLPVNLGKNLFDKSDTSLLMQRYISGSGVLGNSGSDYSIYIPCEPNTTYTIQKGLQSTTAKNRFRIGTCSTVPTNGTQLSDYWNAGDGSTTKSHTITTNASAKYLVVFCYTSDTSTIDDMLGTIQIERGSQATSYASYFTPIELAKIGTYQDRIYKTSGKWYIEKQVGKMVLDGTEVNIGAYPYGTNSYLMSNTGVAQTPTNSELVISTHFVSTSYDNRTQAINNMIYADGGTLGQIDFRNTAWTSLADFKTWLGTNKPSIYFVLATPTTTEITNQALVDQLNSLQHANTYTDLTNFSTSSVYLNGFLSVKAYPKGGTPTGGYIWEAGGAGGPTTLTVDGVDNAYPIWTVPGPATNPTLTNITTGQTISWTGTVPNGQELVIDMANQTASLSGANVFEFVSGSWLTLEPGNNRISYSAINATDPSKLEWNGVTG